MNQCGEFTRIIAIATLSWVKKLIGHRVRVAVNINLTRAKTLFDRSSRTAPLCR